MLIPLKNCSKTHLCFTIFYFCIVLNSFKAGNFLVSYFSLKIFHKGLFCIEETYTLSFCVVQTYFVGETAKNSCQNVQKRLSKQEAREAHGNIEGFDF